MAGRGMQTQFRDPDKVGVAHRPDAPFAVEFGPWAVTYDGMTMAAFRSLADADAHVVTQGRAFVAYADVTPHDVTRRIERLDRIVCEGGENHVFRIANWEDHTLSQHTTREEAEEEIEALGGARDAWTRWLDSGLTPSPA